MLLRTLTAAAILLLAPEALAKGPCKRLAPPPYSASRSRCTWASSP